MQTLSRNEWVAGAFQALSEGGIAALRVEPLAARLGVTKGSFYHHFENRRALHMAILDVWEQRGTSEIIEEVEAASHDPVERIRRLAHQTMHVDPFSDAIETGIRAWAATDSTVAAAVARVDDRRLGFAASLLRQSGMDAPLARRRARVMYRVLIGEFVWRSAGGPAMTAREIDELVEMLVGAGDERLAP